MAVRLASWLLKDALEKEQTELLRDRLAGMTKEPASLLGPEEVEEEWREGRPSLVGVGTSNWWKSMSLGVSTIDDRRRGEVMPARMRWIEFYSID
jgi:hypothetical protein